MSDGGASPNPDLSDRRLALLEYSRDSYDRAHKRFEWLDQKAHRYSTVVVAIVASANFVLIPEVARSAKGNPLVWSAAIFLILAGLLIVSAIGSIVAALWAMRPQAIPAPSSEPEPVVDAFIGQSVDAVAEGEARHNMQCAHEVTRICEARARAIKISFRLMMTSVLLYVATLVVWLVRLKS